MASLIQGFEYDIFISYRQKDNKYDGWVTEFADNLKKELEATFKEEVSVYFDINPHDGLLETHDVDASLKEKLKCLVFVPIISRTYCDPKSFAWEHEFKAFADQASQDRFGLKVKLPNGNVANRVLPVRIHDLENTDIKLCESVLGGVLRGIQFIYAEPGVNRPLKSDDDEKVNLNKTRYRNQINKVANAIKEIITGLKYPDATIDADRVTVPLTDKGMRKFPWKKVAIPAVIITLLLIVGLLILSSVIKKSSGGTSETGKSIAVLPFDNLSNDPDQEYLSVGIVVEIMDKLFKIGDLKVKARTSSERYINSNLSVKEIARELDVATIMEGSVLKIGNNVRITVQLIDARTEANIWSEIYNRDMSDIFSIQSEVARAVARELKAVITPEAKQLIGKKPTTNMAAYEAYWRGMLSYWKVNRDDMEIAMEYFKLAIKEDPGFALAYAGIGRVWRGREQMGIIRPSEATPRAEEAIMKALELDSTYSETYHALGGLMTWSKWDWKAGEESFRKALDLNPKNADAHSSFSHLLNILGRADEAMEHIAIALDLDPMNSKILAFYGMDLMFVRRYDDAIKAFQKTLDLDPLQGLASNIIPALYLSGREVEATEMLKKFFKESPDAIDEGYNEGGFRGAVKKLADVRADKSKTTYIAPCGIAQQYSLAGDIDNAIFWLEKAYEEHDPMLPYLLYPTYDILRDDPRFQEIARKMGLPYK